MKDERKIHMKDKNVKFLNYSKDYLIQRMSTYFCINVSDYTILNSLVSKIVSSKWHNIFPCPSYLHKTWRVYDLL